MMTAAAACVHLRLGSSAVRIGPLSIKRKDVFARQSRRETTMHRKEKGSLTVEASIGLTIFALFVLFLFSFARVYRAQNMVGHATLQSADNIALESYLRETAMEGDLEDILYLASLISETDSLSEDGLESLRTANLQSLAKARFTSAIAPSDVEADEKLRNLGVKDGLQGLDFSNSRVDLEKDDIIVVVNYTIKMQFPLWGASEIDVTKTAKAKTFGEILFAITTEPSDPSMGTTTGDDKVTLGEMVEITAIPNYGYRFVQWNDGVTDNPRWVKVTEAAHYIAEFEAVTNGVNLSINNGPWNVCENEYGKVTGAGEYGYTEIVTISAQANEHYDFIGWDDDGNGTVDNTSPTRQFRIDQIETAYYFSALFRPKVYRITVKANPAGMGTALAVQGNVSGASIDAEYGSTVQLIATVSNTIRYRFDHWSNGRTQTSTTITVSGNETITAHFADNTYRVRFMDGSRVLSTVNVIRGSSIAGSAPYITTGMPQDPSKSNAYFDKWMTGGSVFTANTIVNSDLDVYAYWKFKVTFNANGGLIKGRTSYDAWAYQGRDFDFSEYTPSRDGYAFGGWKNGNTTYSGRRVLTGNLTVTAQWNCSHPDSARVVSGVAVSPNATYCCDVTVTYKCSQCGATLSSYTEHNQRRQHNFYGRCDEAHWVSYFNGQKEGGCGRIHYGSYCYCVVCKYCKCSKGNLIPWYRSWWCGERHSGVTNGVPAFTPVNGHYYPDW